MLTPHQIAEIRGRKAGGEFVASGTIVRSQPQHDFKSEIAGKLYCLATLICAKPGSRLPPSPASVGQPIVCAYTPFRRSVLENVASIRSAAERTLAAECRLITSP